jgi:hypothetical protein
MLAAQRVFYCCLQFVPNICHCNIFTALRTKSSLGMRGNACRSSRKVSVIFVQF